MASPYQQQVRQRKFIYVGLILSIGVFLILPRMTERFARIVLGAAAIFAAPVQAKDWKTVRIGMDATYAPFESAAGYGRIFGPT